MKVKTKFYGEVEVAPEEIIHFPAGLPGFEEDKEYHFIQHEDSVFGCLQSCRQAETAFIVLSPFIICPDYDFELTATNQKELGLSKLEEVLVLAVVTIPPGKPEEATVNLQAPIVINQTMKKGMQVILSDSGYPLRCPLWTKQTSSSVAAAK
ncbi:MAG TPA: flagellar assembly protein FliW [Firmicutes bacterium]|jgi:flagellar assembly factor FliW|nr:flagellar assembly protein FliW [Bacillota bacterium]